MSVLHILVYIAKGTFLRRAWSKRPPNEAALLELFSRILVGQGNCSDTLATVLEKGLEFDWKGVYDIVNPYGDRRGTLFESVWIFDLDKDVLFLTKIDRSCSAPLALARERVLTLDDFEPLNPPQRTITGEQTLPGPYWEPELAPSPRAKSFLGRMLADFAHTWRHVLRRQMNRTTFMKLAYATIWISNTEFTISELTGFQHITGSGPYARVVDLPSWETPEATFVQAGSSWFAIAQDINEGRKMVQDHVDNNHSEAAEKTYVILTLRQVVLCEAYAGRLRWARPETLFDGDSAPDTAINMLLWAVNITNTVP